MKQDHLESASNIVTTIANKQMINNTSRTHYTWDEIKNLLRAGHLNFLDRDPHVQERYLVRREHIRANYVSYEDYIFIHHFGYGYMEVEVEEEVKEQQQQDALNSMRASIQQIGGAHDGFPMTATMRKKRMCILPEVVDEDVTFFLPNEFPYGKFPPHTAHWLLWSHRDLACEEIEAHVRKQLADPAMRKKIVESTNTLVQFDDTDQSMQIDFTYFVNPPVLRTVKNIFHAHILFNISFK
eukprot:GEZU01005512.1.p1 GENE.GEZU01005512.1~~GEZU01005512.1.p1  ORF type:complete len:240 (+),score=51.48 GEZU01005512.1:153-872(+)